MADRSMAVAPSPAVRAAPGGRRSAKRSAILDAATQVFLANGFDQTSMDVVAQQAGVSKTTVYAHFGDKVGLFHAVFERSAALLDVDLDQVVLDKSSTPQDKLVKVLVALTEAQVLDGFRAFLRIMIAESRRQPELMRVLAEHGEPYAVTVVAGILIEDGAQHGYRVPTPNIYAGLLLRMATASLQLDCLLDDGFRPSAEFLEQHARWTARLFLDGLRPRDGHAVPAVDYTYPWIPVARD